MSRLTRQEMKRDEVMEGLSRAAEWIRDNRRLLQWLGIALGVALLLYLGGSAWVRHRTREANARLTEALKSGEGRADPAAMREIAERYSGSAAAGIAEAYLGEAAAAEGDLDRARELWTEALGAAEGSMLEASLRLNLLDLDRLQGRSETAVEDLRAMLARESSPLPLDVALYELAVTLEELGRDEEAAAALQRLVDERPGSPYVADARARLDALGG